MTDDSALQPEDAVYQDGVCRDHAPWKRCKYCEDIPRIKSDFPSELREPKQSFDEAKSSDNDSKLPPVTALSSESGRGMGAAFYGSISLVKKHMEAFRELELFMANHGITSLAILSMRVESGATEQALHTITNEQAAAIASAGYEMHEIGDDAAYDRWVKALAEARVEVVE